MKKLLTAVFATANMLLLLPAILLAQIPVTVDGEQAGAPVTFGIPFPRGELNSAANVRVLNRAGEEIASQITPVTTWLPADESIKWIWVDFFTDGSGRYTIDYGPDVRRTVQTTSPIQFVNNQRANGGAAIDTGPLRFRVQKGGNSSGFIDQVEFNPDGDEFGAEDLIAQGIRGRGSFLDLLDGNGIDPSSPSSSRPSLRRVPAPCTPSFALRANTVTGSPITYRRHLWPTSMHMPECRT